MFIQVRKYKIDFVSLLFKRKKFTRDKDSIYRSFPLKEKERKDTNSHRKENIKKKRSHFKTTRGGEIPSSYKSY